MTDRHRRPIVPAPRSRVFAFAVLGCTLVTVVAGSVLLLAAGGALPVAIVAGGLAFAVAAGLLLARRVDTVALVLSLAAVGSGSTVLAMGHAAATGEATMMGAIVGTLWMPGSLIVVSVLGAAVVGASRVLIAAGAVLSLGLWVTTTVSVLVPDERGVGLVTTAAAVLWTAIALGGIGSLAIVQAREEGRRKDAAAWLAVAQGLVLAAAVPSYAGDTGVVAVIAAAVLPAAVILLAAVLLLTALTRAGGPVDVETARVLSWVLLAAALVAAYAAVVGVISDVAPVAPTTAGMFAVAALALAVEPARRWVRRGVDQLAYGRSAEPRVLMRRLSDELLKHEQAPGADVLGLIAEALGDALRLSWVELRSTRPDGVVARRGTPAAPDRVVHFNLRGQDGVVATLSVEGPARDGIDRRTRQVLTTISGMLALAVRLADANSDIEWARVQLVQVADHERRLVRRELIEGVGTGVRAARARIAAAAAAMTSGEPDAPRLLSTAGTVLQEVTKEVRDLARTLLPGALDAGDAAGALDELTRRFPRPALRVTLPTPGGRGEDLALALIYHLTAETVLRARRDSAVHEIDVEVERRVDGLAVRVSVVGVGEGPAGALGTLAARARAGGAEVAEPERVGGAVALRMRVAT